MRGPCTRSAPCARVTLANRLLADVGAYLTGRQEKDLATMSPHFWTTAPLGWSGLLRVDGEVWNWMGNLTECEFTRAAGEEEELTELRVSQGQQQRAPTTSTPPPPRLLSSTPARSTRPASPSPPPSSPRSLLPTSSANPSPSPTSPSLSPLSTDAITRSKSTPTSTGFGPPMERRRSWNGARRAGNDGSDRGSLCRTSGASRKSRTGSSKGTSGTLRRRRGRS